LQVVADCENDEKFLAQSNFGTNEHV
jgi:hypothetical protein